LKLHFTPRDHAALGWPFAWAAVVGVIDFGAPGIPYLGADVGGLDLDFWSRMLDCFLYLPPMVYAVRGTML
jgi:hypothetical protein